MVNQITTGQTAYVSVTPSQLNDYVAQTADPDAKWTSLTRPLLYEGQKLMYGQELGYVTYGTSSLSATCENLPLAMTWCDWFYSIEGSEYSSWGPEGIVWEYDENGEKTLTDFMLNHPEGMGTQWALLMYSANNLGDATLFSQARSYAYPGGRELLEMAQRWVSRATRVSTIFPLDSDCPTMIPRRSMPTPATSLPISTRTTLPSS